MQKRLGNHTAIIMFYQQHVLVPLTNLSLGSRAIVSRRHLLGS